MQEEIVDETDEYVDVHKRWLDYFEIAKYFIWELILTLN